MKLKEFIRKLEKILKEHEDSLEVRMADGISIREPIYLENFLNKKTVIITDKTQYVRILSKGIKSGEDR